LEPKLIVIDNKQGLDELKDYLKDKEYVSYDCETTGVHRGAEIVGFSVCAEEDKAYYVVIGIWNNVEKILSYTGLSEKSADIISDLKSKKLIMHNGVFDCMMTESYFKIRLIESLHTDTMILAHLLNENRRVGLKELAAQYFGDNAKQEQTEMKESALRNGAKLTKAQYDMYKADPKILGKYGAKDALLTYKLFIALVPELFDQGLDKFFYEDESMPLLRGPTYDMNSTGLTIDTNALLTLKKTLEMECLEAEAFINAEVHGHVSEKYPGTNAKNKFNFSSNVQLAWLLFGKLGLEFGTLTKKGKEVCKDELGLKLPYTYSAKKEFIQQCENSVNTKINNPYKYITVDNKTLQTFASKYKWIAKLLEYKKKLKLLNTYVEGIEERIQYGVIYPSFLQHGTTSGRYSSRNPNFQNLPRDDKSIKNCIVARPNKVLVGADYSQLEPRVFAFYSNDERLKNSFNGLDDFYSVMGINIFGITDAIPRKDGSPDAFGVKYKHLRNLAKVVGLASTYGATARQLSNITGKSVEETQEIIEDYFNSFPGVKNMMLEAHKTAKTKGQVINYFGRPRRMPEALKITSIYGDLDHSEYTYAIRNTLNLAVNHQIQSTAASIVNRAMISFHNNIKQLGIDCKIVLQVHDEIIVECDEKHAQDVKLLLEYDMVNTTILSGIPMEAIPNIGKTLGSLK